MDTKKIKESL
jgi:thioredoxin-like negative regulator of GroEL